MLFRQRPGNFYLTKLRRACRTSSMKLLTTAEAADTLGVTVRTVNRYAMSGRLPVAHKSGGRTGANLFDADTVHKFDAEAPVPSITVEPGDEATGSGADPGPVATSQRVHPGTSASEVREGRRRLAGGAA